MLARSPNRISVPLLPNATIQKQHHDHHHCNLRNSSQPYFRAVESSQKTISGLSIAWKRELDLLQTHPFCSSTPRVKQHSPIIVLTLCYHRLILPHSPHKFLLPRHITQSAPLIWRPLPSELCTSSNVTLSSRERRRARGEMIPSLYFPRLDLSQSPLTESSTFMLM